MKKLLCLFLVLAAIFSLCACGTPKEEVSPYAATQEDIDHLEKMYEGRTVYFGEAHVHSDTGGMSDGKVTLPEWKAFMESHNMDFATIVDHRQVAHMYMDEWDDACFIGGTELATVVVDSGATKKNMHYNMVFTDPEAFKNVLRSNISFEYEEDTTFCEAPGWSSTNLKALIQKVKDEGGMWVHVHPKCDGYLNAENPAAYWFADETGLEVMIGWTGHSTTNEDTKKCYKLWTDLLELDARVWATAGSDSHSEPNVNALTAIYAEDLTPESLFSHMRVGDFAPGFAGVRMTIGDAIMGSSGSFAGQRVVFCVDKFHESAVEQFSGFQVVLFEGNKEVFRENIDHTKTNYFAYDCAETAKYYRVEVQEKDGNPIAIGNPIWKG